MRRTSGLLAIVAAALLGGMLTAFPAHAAVSKITVGHTCADLGNDGQDKAVICVDLQEWPISDGSGQELAEVLVTGFCETLSGDPALDTSYPRCANVAVTAGTYDAANQNNVDAYKWSESCGHGTNPLCTDNGRNYFQYASGPSILAVPAGACYPIWGVAFTGPGSTGSTVELPGSSQTKALQANISTGHWSVGSGC